MKKWRAVLGMLGVLGLAAGCANAITAVQDGKAMATIVISEAALKADPYVPSRGDPGTPASKVHFAALDLQHYVEKMSGAKLPIVADTAQVAGPMILVGASKLTEPMKLDIPAGLTRERRDEGYVVVNHGETLVLAGNDDGPYFGTHYAVAEFLERLGVRWFMPTEFGEVVPTLKTVALADVDFRDKPDFPMRTWWSHMTPEMAQQEATWKIRNRIQPADASLLAVPGDSSLRAYVPDEKYVATNPEYFAKNPDGTLNKFMPNLTNPKAAALVAEKIKERARAEAQKTGKPLHSIGIAPDDGLPMDCNPETMKVNQGFTELVGREGVLAELNVSEEWFSFINNVAADVAKEFPDLIISTNGYANRCVPPEGGGLHPNLAVMYAAIWADTLKPFDSPKSWHGTMQGACLERWCELNKRVFIYNYDYNMLVTCLTPVPTVRKLAHNLPLMKKWGMFGFFDEARQAYMEHGITTYYMRARLYFDADLDVEAKLTDFFQKWYGPAAAPARAFWDALEARMQDTPLLGHEDRILPYVYTPDLIAALEKHVADAERLADTDTTKLHVKADRLILEHLRGYMAMHEADFAGNYAEAAKQADQMFKHREALNAICPFFNMPESREPGKTYLSGAWYWNLTDRRAFYQKLADMMNGKTGELIALAPREVRFSLDEPDLGKYEHWYAPAYDRSKWRTLDTTRPYYLQGYLSDRGVPYRGLMWYVFDVDVPKSAAGKRVMVYSPVIVAEAWVWMNGRYIGHRPYTEAYIRPAPLELDVTDAVKPGEHNVIAVRVGTGMNLTQAPDGFQGRLFLYSPKPGAEAGK